MRVIVCGGRHYQDRAALYACLDAFDAVYSGGITVVIHGGASGADTLAALWGRDRGKQLVAYPAHWKKHGLRAGMIRNRQMLKEAEPDYVIAFPGGRGTANMIQIARLAGVPVFELDAYRNDSYPERACERCGVLYRGPAVYCSKACAVADA